MLGTQLLDEALQLANALYRYGVQLQASERGRLIAFLKVLSDRKTNGKTAEKIEIPEEFSNCELLKTVALRINNPSSLKLNQYFASVYSVYLALFQFHLGAKSEGSSFYKQLLAVVAGTRSYISIHESFFTRVGTYGKVLTPEELTTKLGQLLARIEISTVQYSWSLNYNPENLKGHAEYVNQLLALNTPVLSLPKSTSIPYGILSELSEAVKNRNPICTLQVSGVKPKLNKLVFDFWKQSPVQEQGSNKENLFEPSSNQISCGQSLVSNELNVEEHQFKPSSNQISCGQSLVSNELNVEEHQFKPSSNQISCGQSLVSNELNIEDHQLKAITLTA
ncbi:MAG: hypothetical protein JSS53_08900 [Proteobacteria bacterium]|nr:hypothetical protein [Pseudomonadota bacterium]